MSTPWPDDWHERMAGAGCAMCGNLGLEDNSFGVRILEGEYADVFLQRLALSPGYSIGIWKHGHVAELTDLDERALAGFTAEVVDAARAIHGVFHPAKLNFETLGNLLPHLHTHVVPRYLDDPAPGRPLLGAPGTEEPGQINEETFRAQVAQLRAAAGMRGR